MLNRDDDWELAPYEGADEPGVLWPVLRNLGVLIAACLVMALIVRGLAGGFDAAKPTGAQPGRQLLAAGTPARPAVDSGYSITIPAGANGHFVVDAMANGSQVTFLIDTGATGILLNQEDAQKAGIHPASLTYDTQVQTANGDISVAQAKVREIRIAGLIVDDLEVWVTRAPMPISLLGMTFLGRLASYEARKDGLVLRW